MFIPEAKISDEQDKKTLAILNERFDRLHKSCGNTHKGIQIVVAELRNFQHTSRNTAIRLKGFPSNMPIWTPKQSVERLQNQFAPGWTILRRPRPTETPRGPGKTTPGLLSSPASGAPKAGA